MFLLKTNKHLTPKKYFWMYKNTSSVQHHKTQIQTRRKLQVYYQMDYTLKGIINVINQGILIL